MKRLQIWIALVSSAYLCGIPQALAACNPPGPEMTSKRLSDFIRDPSVILAEPASSNSSAAALSVNVSQLVVTGSDTVDALKTAIDQATAAQSRAIGRGLYSALEYCRSASPNAATRIDKIVGSLTNKDVLSSYIEAKISTGVESSSATSSNGYGSSASAYKPSVGGLVGQPSASSAGSLNLSDPFGSPDDWK